MKLRWPASGKTLLFGLRPGLLVSLLTGCATTSSIDLSAGGVVDPPSLTSSIRCARGTALVYGQTMGVETAAWCERPGGVKHGPFLDWYENHQKKSAGEYEEGHRKGTWSFWLPNGQLDSRMDYAKGTAGSPANP